MEEERKIFLERADNLINQIKNLKVSKAYDSLMYIIESAWCDGYFTKELHLIKSYLNTTDLNLNQLEKF